MIRPIHLARSRLDAAKERLAAEMAPPPEAAMLPLELKSPVDMTDEEIDRAAEQIRQEMRREKAAVEKPQVFPGFGTNSSGPPIGGSGGGASGSATG